MTRSARLERGYRRVLACYPKAFRRENEEEILGVLLATSGEGQQRAGLAESADLLMGALRMHLGMSRSPRPVRTAVRLMCLGAVLTLALMVTILATLGSTRSDFLREVTAAQWHAVMLAYAVPMLAGAPIGAGLWLWLARATGQGHNWARPAFAALFGLLTLWLLFGLAEGDSKGTLPFVLADLIAAVALWLVALAAVLLIFSSTASTYYRQEPIRQ